MPVEVRQLWFDASEATLAFELIGAGFSSAIPHGKVLAVVKGLGQKVHLPFALRTAQSR
jgi:hypothetical protein